MVKTFLVNHVSLGRITENTIHLPLGGQRQKKRKQLNCCLKRMSLLWQDCLMNKTARCQSVLVV